MVERNWGQPSQHRLCGWPLPNQFIVYGSSKGAIHSISQNLRIELKGTRVRVTEICPGRIATNFFNISIYDAKKV
jgi:short-subunit dehydrogenase